MIAVSDNFKEVLKQDLIDQKIKGKVVINYTDPFLDNTITQTVNNENRVSALSQTTNGRYETSYKYASADGSFKPDGTFHPAPYSDYEKSYTELGYWGNIVSESDCSFTTNPELEISFEKRNISEIRVVGDDKRNEYPVDFTINFYDKYYSPIDSKSFVNNTKVDFVYPLLTEISNVEKMKLTITKWSTAGSVAKIIEFSPSLVVEYDEDLKNIELSEEKESDYANSFYGGIGHSEVDIQIDNSKRLFDVNNPNSNIANYIKPNRRIEPYIGVVKEDQTIEYVRLGIFYSDDFSVPESSITASIHGWNRLTLLERTNFTMSSVQLNYSFYDFFKYVLNDAGLTDYEINIDASLKDSEYIIPVAFLESDTHLEILRKLCNASLSYMYVDRDGVIRVEGIKYTDTHSYKIQEEITTDDYFDKDNSNKYNNIVNYVTINTSPLILQDASDCYTKTITISANSILNLTAKYSSKPFVNQTASIDGTPSGITINSETHYPEYSDLIIENTNATDTEIKVIINGQQYENENQDTYIDSDGDSIISNGKFEYEIDDNELIQTEVLALKIIDNLLDTMSAPNNDLDLSCIGNPALEINDRIMIQDNYTFDQFHINSQIISFDGYLSTKITGKKAKVVPEYKEYVYGDTYYSDTDENYYQN